MVYLDGIVERLTYYNKESGYTVLRLRTTASDAKQSGLRSHGSTLDALVTVVGSLPPVNPGESLRMAGEWVSHSKYGYQFKATNIEQTIPVSEDGIRRYLGSDLIKGIGPSIAERIVNNFGANTVQVIEQHPKLLLEVSNIGPKRVQMITEAWEKHKAVKNVMMFLQGQGIGASLALKIYKQYDDKAETIVTQDPYRLTRDIWGIGFKTADIIAKKLGVGENSPDRIEAGITHTLKEMSNEGHVYSPETELLRRAADLLGVSEYTVGKSLSQMLDGNTIRRDKLHYTAQDKVVGGEHTGEILLKEEAIYLTPFFYSEVEVAERLQIIAETSASRLARLKDKSLDWMLTWSNTDITLSTEQVEAIQRALQHKVSIITGGPGTGKTTCLGTLISILESTGHTVALASPTGRAAKRLSEATGSVAKTIHRLLGFQPPEGFKYNEENQLPVDVLIVDEASMIDILLMNGLLKALNPETHLLLVGDVDQLPPVRAGDVLRDVIRSRTVPVTRLSVIFRQAHTSLIVTNAHRINQGKTLLFPKDANDFFLFQIEDSENLDGWIVDIVQNRMPFRFNLRPLQAQVLSPMYRGPAGVENLNLRLQAALNPPDRGKTERSIGRNLFRVGDKIMQTRNNYDKDVFNGDIGRLTDINADDATLSAMFDESGERKVTYNWEEAEDLVHAFAISVHKSQGSEYSAVVMPVTTQHYVMLQRNLLYTAVTRAKTLCVLVGSKRAIQIAIRNDEVAHRYSGLGMRLLQNH